MSKLSEMFAALKAKFATNPAALAEVEAQEQAELAAEAAAEAAAVKAAAELAAEEDAHMDAMRPSMGFASLVEKYDRQKAEQAAKVAQ